MSIILVRIGVSSMMLSERFGDVLSELEEKVGVILADDDIYVLREERPGE